MKVKILTTAGNFVDEGLLYKGIYISELPTKLHRFDETIEGLESRYNMMREALANFYNVDIIIQNLNQCQLTGYELSDGSGLLLDIKHLKDYRTAKGLTLRNVESLTGLSNAYLSLLENGKIKNPSFEVIKKLNDVYK